MTYTLALANIIPASSAFYVTVNSAGRSVSAVAVSGTIVHLTLSSPVAHDDIVTVAYTKPSSNPLQTNSGGQAVSVSGMSVTNNVPPPTPVLLNSVIEDATSNIIELTYNTELANIIPASNAFTLTVNSVPKTINSVSVIGPDVQLTLAYEIVCNDVVKLGYTKPVINPIQCTHGGEATNLSNLTVTNNVQEDPITVVRKTPKYIKITIYPNPARDYFNIIFGDLGEVIPRIIRIINGSGIKMSEILVDLGTSELYIPIHLVSGIYYVQIVSENGYVIATRKLMVKN